MEYQDYFKNQSSHRMFRQSMAASATKAGSYTRTLKFPLEEPKEGWTFDFESARQLFNTTEGIGKGSLIGFHFCLMLSGFRLFSKSGETQIFRSQTALPMVEFEESFTYAFSQSCRQFTPSGLINYFSAEKRTYNNEGVALTESMLAGELYRLATTTLPEKDAKLNTPLQAACSRIAQEICNKVSQWRELENHVEEALQAVDVALASLGYSFPKIAGCTDALAPLTPVNSTIDFDIHAPVVQELIPALMPYQVIASQSMLLRREGNKVDKNTLQAVITTANNNGLSWLFGNGLKLWKTTSKEELCRLYNVPETHRYLVTRIKEWADAVRVDPLYGGGYSKYRSSVGGKLDSWIANYSRRLSELSDALGNMTPDSLKLPDSLLLPEFEHLMGGSDFSALELQALLNSVEEQKVSTQTALNTLCGNALVLPQQHDIDEFHLFSALLSDVSGEIEALNHRLEQEQEKTRSSTQNLSMLQFKKPTWLKTLPKVPGLSGGVPDYENEVLEALERYHSLSLAYFSQVEMLVGNPEWGSVLSATEHNEKQRLKQHPRFAELDITELAQRRLLDKYLRQALKAPIELKKIIIERMLDANLPVAVADAHVQDKDKSEYQYKHQKASLNQLLLNRKGRVYVSPYAKSNHQAWALDCAAFSKIDILKWLELDLVWLQENLEQNVAEQYRLMLDWRVFKARQQLLTLPDVVFTSEFSKGLISQLPLPSIMLAQLRQETLSRAQTSKLLNYGVSEIRGLLALIFRESFFLRTRFSRINDNQLWYAPKLNEHNEWVWQTPPQLLRSNKSIIDVVSHFKQNNDRIVIPSLKQLAKQQGAQWQRSSDSVGALLRQMPHDWYLNLGFVKAFDFASQEAVSLDKKKIGQPRFAKQLCRLKGSTVFKGWLDKQLVQSDVTVGDYTLIIEQYFKQTITVEHGRLTVAITPASESKKKIAKNGLKLEVALPITQQATKETVDFSQTYIGIDLGEVGIGYSVVCSKTHEVIAFDSVAIRSVRNLINAVKRHRKNKQPAQKFTQRFDTSLMKLRENAVGDICHVINSLMAHFQGVPILESTVGNLASGSNQLQLVYDKVLNLYLFSNTDAHKAARSHFWCGSDSWRHAFAKETVKKYGTQKLVERDLHLFPGSSVHPAGTSQRCSCCGQNPYSLLKNAFANSKRLSTDEHGVLDVGEAKLRFVSAQMNSTQWKTLSKGKQNKLKHQRSMLKRQNKRPPMIYPVSSRSFTLEEAKRQLRRQLRRAPESLRSKDTMQSQYFCAVQGCEHRMHADVNAAINIVFKWLKTRKITR